MNWLSRNSSALQALAAVFTVLIAVVALIGVKVQVDASYRVQREQSAKEIYRELLNLSIANPDLTEPNYKVEFKPYEAAQRARGKHQLLAE